MKKLFSIFSFALISGLISCNDATQKGQLSDEEQKNLEASRTITKAFETGDVSMIDSVVASDFVDHTEKGDLNRDSLKAMVKMVRQHFPDMKTEVIRELADDDYVFTQIRYSGTSQGQMGMPVGPYDMHVIEVARFKDGKAVEHWAYMEYRDMVKMMTPPADTSKPQ